MFTRKRNSRKDILHSPVLKSEKINHREIVHEDKYAKIDSRVKEVFDYCMQMFENEVFEFLNKMQLAVI